MQNVIFGGATVPVINFKTLSGVPLRGSGGREHPGRGSYPEDWGSGDLRPI